MGCDSINFLPKSVNKKEVQEFLLILGYKKVSHDYFYYFDRINREQITGVGASISETRPYEIHLRTNIWRTIKDHEIHNWTIRQIKKRFGGDFQSDEGKNRYLNFSGVERRKAEAGCDLAYFDFSNNITTIKGFLNIIKYSENTHSIHEIPKLINPIISSTNIGLPFLISVMEEYLRNCYISLLRYSPEKRNILKKSNIQTEELYEVAENHSSIEEIIARFKSFQNIDLINRNFIEIRKELVFIDSLKRYHPRRKYHEVLKNIIEKRHKMIHRFQMDYNYGISEFEKDIRTIEKVIQIFHDRIIDLYNWNPRDW